MTDSCEKKEASWWNGLFERYPTKEGREREEGRGNAAPDLRMQALPPYT
ncbi:MAG: hypothetical protein ACLVAW_24825 [Eisenbergiella massiliensis]